MNSFCIFGISGYSGSGKTTLIKKILPELKREGLSVGILKHIHHKLNIDMRGKDTDSFFRAGADIVLAHDDIQGFERFRTEGRKASDMIRMFPASLDLVIVEGHKETDLPGIWLEEKSSGRKSANCRGGGKAIIFRDDPDYHLKTLAHIRQIMERSHSGRTVRAGLLIGGRSIRMGSPKALLKLRGMTLASRTFKTLSSVSGQAVLLGTGNIPASLNSAERLPDVPDIHGPLSGLLSAFRWAPDSTWIISSVDMPLMNRDAWRWLLGQRRPGVWAVLPRIKGCRGVETTGAVYEPMIFGHAEALAAEGIESLQEMARHPKVITPVIPAGLQYAWSNVNTPSEWNKALAGL